MGTRLVASQARDPFPQRLADKGKSHADVAAEEIAA
jgi:hypothetical protein